MGRLATGPEPSARRGFTLIEMIGVLAILGILATVLTPNALKAIDRAAVRAETDTLRQLAKSLRAYVVETKTLPSASAWSSQLAAYADLNAVALRSNPRGIDRVLLFDPASSPSPRVMILSSMRAGLSLPRSNSINTAARFQSIWDTPDHAVPPRSSWGRWSQWNSVDQAGDYLVIQRINLTPIYLDELKTARVALNNTTTVTCSYRLYDAEGSQIARATIPAQTPVMLSNLSKGERVDIFGDSLYSDLVYTHFADGTDVSFDLSDWIASP